MSDYPIIEQQALGAVSSATFRRARRSLSELPAQPPGAVLVASVDGEHAVLRRRALRDTDDVFVNASSIAVVDKTPGRRAVAHLTVPSAAPADQFAVRVTFSCTVRDPVAVVREVPGDLVPVLESYLRANSKLLHLGSKFALSDVVEFRRTADAHVRAWCRGRPPQYSGMEIKFEELDVDVPEGIIQEAHGQREHEKTLLDTERKHELTTLSEQLEHTRAQLDEERRQELEGLRKVFSLDQAELIEAVLRRGPHAIEALYLELGDERYGNSADRAYAERERIENKFRELIGRLADGGHLDGVAIDTPRLVDEYVNRLLARTASPDDGAAANGNATIVVDEKEPAAERRAPSLLKARDGSDVDGDGRPPDPADEDSLDV